MIAGLINEVHKPLWKNEAWNNTRLPWSLRLTLLAGLPQKTGPTSRLSAARWAELVDSASVKSVDRLFWQGEGPARSQQGILIAQLVTALALYQAEHGSLPAELSQIISGGYLKEMPIDPLSGQPFGYRMATKNQTVEGTVAKLSVVAGQGVVWSKGEPARPRFTVPFWKTSKEKQP